MDWKRQDKHTKATACGTTRIGLGGTCADEAWEVCGQGCSPGVVSGGP